MRVTANQAVTKRNRLDRSVSSAEKRSRRAAMMRVRGSARPHSGVLTSADTAQGENRLFKGQNQAILTSDGRPLGEFRRMRVRSPNLGDLPFQHRATCGSLTVARCRQGLLSLTRCSTRGDMAIKLSVSFDQGWRL